MEPTSEEDKMQVLVTWEVVAVGRWGAATRKKTSVRVEPALPKLNMDTVHLPSINLNRSIKERSHQRVPVQVLYKRTPLNGWMRPMTPMNGPDEGIKISAALISVLRQLGRGSSFDGLRREPSRTKEIGWKRASSPSSSLPADLLSPLAQFDRLLQKRSRLKGSH
ncbi:hypothetical protein OPV22_034572 [Ensete ventricosum]|uniref:Uncharacterized protein n=1 Tax=Ensete ventricosum TaxID=4639 RepID=A0AAV8P4F4_ENSVE|nr:hypothetical protein OPV22_034572 [Ensete ventricosum]